MMLLFIGALAVFLGCLGMLVWPFLSAGNPSFEDRISRSKWSDL